MELFQKKEKESVDISPYFRSGKNEKIMGEENRQKGNSRQMFSLKKKYSNKKEKGQVDLLEENIEELQREIAELESGKSQKVSQNKEQEREIKLKEFILKKKHEELINKKEELKEIQSRKDEKSVRSKVLEQKITDLAFQIKEKENEIGKVKEKILGQEQWEESQIEDFKQELAEEYKLKEKELQKLEKNYQHKLNQVQRRLADKKRELSNKYEIKISSLEGRVNSKYREELENLKNESFELSELEKQLIQRKSILDREFEESTKLKNRREIELKDLNRKVDKLKSLIIEIEEKILDCDSQILKTESEIGQVSETFSKLKESESIGRSELMRKKQQLENVLIEKTKKDNLLKENSKELDNYQRQISSLDTRLGKLQEDLKFIDAKNDQVNKVTVKCREEISSLKKEVEEVQSAILAKTNGLVSKGETLKKLQLEINTRRKNIDQIKQEKYDLNSKTLKLNKYLAESREEKSILEKELSGLIRQYVEQEKDFANLRKVQSARLEENDELKTKLEAKSNQLIELGNDISDIESEIESLNLEKERLSNEIRTMDSQIETKLTQKSRLKDQIESEIAFEIKDKKNALIEAKNRLELVQEDYESEKNKKQKALNNLQEVTLEHQNLIESSNSLTEEVTSLKGEILNLEQKQANLLKENEKLNNKIHLDNQVVKELQNKKNNYLEDLETMFLEKQELGELEKDLNTKIELALGTISEKEKNIQLVFEENARLVEQVKLAKERYLKEKEKQLLTEIRETELLEEKSELENLLGKYQVSNATMKQAGQLVKDSQNKNLSTKQVNTTKITRSDDLEKLFRSSSSLKKTLDAFEARFLTSNIFADSLHTIRKGRNLLIQGSGIFESLEETRREIDEIIQDLKTQFSKNGISFDLLVFEGEEDVSFTLEIKRIRKEILTSL